MPCTYCSKQFTMLKWKNRCNECMQKFCADCMVQTRCISCHAVANTFFKRSKLMQLRVKDLRLYLHNRQHSTETCKEKKELIKLIQDVAGFQEPEAEADMHLYDTSVPSPTDPTVVEAEIEEINTDDVSDPRLADMSAPQFEPPSYEHTQESFPTSHEFSNLQQPSSSNVEYSSSSIPSSNTPDKKSLIELSDLQTKEEIESLGVSQLKHLLKSNLVNFTGALEKSDLVQRVVLLYESHQDDNDLLHQSSLGKQSSTDTRDENLCKICWENIVNCVYLECGHMVTCIDCSKAVKDCPICRQHIVRTVRVFKS